MQRLISESLHFAHSVCLHVPYNSQKKVLISVYNIQRLIHLMEAKPVPFQAQTKSLYNIL